MFDYRPGQTKSNSVPVSTPDEARTEEKSASFLSPELQELVDKAIKEQEQSSSCTPHTPTEEDWKWLRGKIDKLLEATDTCNLISYGLSFEERGKLYKYRQALRDLPSTLPSSWTRDSVVWPQKPI